MNSYHIYCYFSGKNDTPRVQEKRKKPRQSGECWAGD